MSYTENSHLQNFEKKHDYHIMLKPTVKNEALSKAHATDQSLSAYIEIALLAYMNNDEDNSCR